MSEIQFDTLITALNSIFFAILLVGIGIAFWCGVAALTLIQINWTLKRK